MDGSSVVEATGGWLLLTIVGSPTGNNMCSEVCGSAQEGEETDREAHLPLAQPCTHLHHCDATCPVISILASRKILTCGSEVWLFS